MKDMNLGKLLLIALGAFAVLGGGVLFVHSLFSGLQEQADQISRLETELVELRMKEQALMKKRQEYARWQVISLPPDLTVANTRYRSLLVNLAQKHNLLVKKLDEAGAQQNVGARGGNLIPLTYKLTLEGTLPKLIAFLTDFYTLNLPHQIRSTTINPLAAGADGKLEVVLGIEAASLPGATPRNFLPAVPDKRVWALEVVAALKGLPGGLAFGPNMLTPTGILGSGKLAHMKGNAREYRQMAEKNVFAGLVPPAATKTAVTTAMPDRDILKEVQLTSISSTPEVTEATLRNRLTNKYTKVRAAGSASQFEIRDEANQLVLKGKVISINPRQLVFQVEGKRHSLEMGQFLADALRRELPEETESKAAAANGSADDS